MNRNVLRSFRVFVVVVTVVLVAHAVPLAQSLTGTLEGTVKDEQGRVRRRPSRCDRTSQFAGDAGRSIPARHECAG